MKLLMGGAGRAERAESASRTGDCGTGETSGTGESASRTGDCGTGETSGTGGRIGKG